VHQTLQVYSFSKVPRIVVRTTDAPFRSNNAARGKALPRSTLRHIRECICQQEMNRYYSCTNSAWWIRHRVFVPADHHEPIILSMDRNLYFLHNAAFYSS